MDADEEQKGLGLGELLILVAGSALLVVAVTAHALPDAATSGTVRGAAQSLHTYLQLARVEAVARDRPCRLTFDAQQHSVAVLDTMGTAEDDDDRVLHGKTLTSAVRVVAPEENPAPAPGLRERTEIEFRPDGSVTAGAITLFDGSEYRRVSADASGRLWIARWDGTGWLPLP